MQLKLAPLVAFLPGLPHAEIKSSTKPCWLPHCFRRTQPTSPSQASPRTLPPKHSATLQGDAPAPVSLGGTSPQISSPTPQAWDGRVPEVLGIQSRASLVLAKPSTIHSLVLKLSKRKTSP